MRHVVLAILLAALAPPSAQAAWSPIVAIPNSTGGVLGSAVALNARGDAAIVWTWTRQADDRSGVRVAVRHGRTGRFVTTTLLPLSARAVRGATIAIDARGETTVAWAERANTHGLLHGRISVRTAFRSTDGRWSRMRTLAHIYPFANALPRLAAAPDRRVLLTFNAGNQQTPGMAAAWRRPGHGFGRVQDLNTGPRGRGYFYDAQTQFDGDGRAYVSGTRDCNTGHSAGVLLTAEPGATRFTSARIVAPTPASDLHFAVTGSGRGALVWRNANCITSAGYGAPWTRRPSRAARPARRRSSPRRGSPWASRRGPEGPPRHGGSGRHRTRPTPSCRLRAATRPAPSAPRSRPPTTSSRSSPTHGATSSSASPIPTG